MKKKLDTELTEAKNASEAMNFLFMGLKWFLIKHTKKTVIALLILIGGSLYVVVDYYKMMQRHQQKTEQTIPPK
jgi:hypothetical protein